MAAVSRPLGQWLGRAPGTQPLGLPIHWSEKENIRWKTPIPHRGWSTPVVMEGLLWLTTATVDGHDFFVIGVDADSGAIRFQEKLFHADRPEPLGNPLNCYASPSPVVEPGRVYVHFGSYGTAALDTKTGAVLWKRSDLPCRHYRGPGSSLVLFENLLILTMDGVDIQYLVALDKETGRTVWKTDRTAEWDDLDADGKPQSEGDLRKAYSTPLVVTVAGDQPHADAQRGGQGPLWLRSGQRARALEDPHARVLRRGQPGLWWGIAYMVTGFGKTELLAVRVGGRGDVTDTNVALEDRQHGAANAVAAAGGRLVLHGQRQRGRHLPGSRLRQAGLARASPRQLRRVPALRGWARLLLQPGRGDNGLPGGTDL